MENLNHGPAYVGRYAPTPSGLMHLGHLSTFWKAQERARQFGGSIFLRIEDIDRERCNSEFEEKIIEDFAWLGLEWDSSAEGGPVRQSNRLGFYQLYLLKLIEKDAVYPCELSRKEIQKAVVATSPSTSEVIFPNSLRDLTNAAKHRRNPFSVNWRFRVPDGEQVGFTDRRSGEHRYIAGHDFGDFLVWRRSGWPSYELAVVVDDIEMSVSEVVRGEDLMVSTSRQILLYDSLKKELPAFYHCPLVKDKNGERLAKSFDSESLQAYRSRGWSRERLLCQIREWAELEYS